MMLRGSYFNCDRLCIVILYLIPFVASPQFAQSLRSLPQAQSTIYPIPRRAHVHTVMSASRFVKPFFVHLFSPRLPAVIASVCMNGGPAKVLEITHYGSSFLV